MSNRIHNRLGGRTVRLSPDGQTLGEGGHTQTRTLNISLFDHLQTDTYESDRAGRCASIAQEQTIAPQKKAMSQFIKR